MLDLFNATPHIMGLQGLMDTSVPMMGTGWPNYLMFFSMALMICYHVLRAIRHQRWLNAPMALMCAVMTWGMCFAVDQQVVAAVYMMALSTAVVAACYVIDSHRHLRAWLDRVLPHPDTSSALGRR